MSSWEGGRADTRRVLRVGLLLLGAVVAFAVGVFLIGEQNNLFSRKNRYWINFESVSGVKPGNPVQLDGVDVGAVEEVILPQDPKQKFIRVWISVDRHYAERIRAPRTIPAAKAGLPPWTNARIKTLGLLGDKYVELTSGTAGYPAVATEGQIPSAEPTNVDALIASGEDVMDNVVEISHSLSAILARMERGEGILGELTKDTPSGARLRDSLVSAVERLDRIAAQVETGNGTLPRLINDPALADRLTSSLDRFESLLVKAQEGEGLLPALLNDKQAKQSFDDTLATLSQVAKDLQALSSGLDKSQALGPRLLKDEEYGREVTAQLKSIVDRLSSVAEKLDRGDGTAGKLINDPKIYDAVNDVVIGINESKMLRWLIRNRQKAGIKKRYEDAGGPKKLEEEAPAPQEEAAPQEEEAPQQEAAPEKAAPAPEDPARSPEPTEPPAGAATEPAATEPGATEPGSESLSGASSLASPPG